MIEKVTFSQEIASDPLAITRVETDIFIEIGEGDDLRSFSFDIASDRDRDHFWQFHTALSRFRSEAIVETDRRARKKTP
jgi:hypothetical protein